MREQFKNLNDFNEIDFIFADYIIEVEGVADYSLYFAALLVSQAASLQYSTFSLANLQEIKGISEQRVAKMKEDILSLKFSKTSGIGEEKKPLIIDVKNKLLYLNKYFVAEQQIASFILQERGAIAISSAVKNRLSCLFDSELVPNWQKVAAFMALRSSFCIISGGPGTGKTTTVAKILWLLLEENRGLKIDLLAPTGKAADRLGEAINKVIDALLQKGDLTAEMAALIPRKASTIHRYLGIREDSDKAIHGQRNKTISDIILVDESSMISLPLFKALLLALKKGCRVILLGDKDQLSSVEIGNVLSDLTSFGNLNNFSEEFCRSYQEATGNELNVSHERVTAFHDMVVQLEHSYRFAGKSPIGQLARLINQPPDDLSVENFQQLFSVERELVDYVANIEIDSEFRGDDLLKLPEIKEFFKEYKELLKGSEVKEILKFLNRFRILTTTRVGELGSEAINREISSTIFHVKSELEFYHGQMVMITKNDYQLELFNGDIGVILFRDGLPLTYFLGKEEGGDLRYFSPMILPLYETAFAMTIHKSQGSEYDKVVLVAANKNLSRQLLYTGVTRARDSVLVVAKLKDLVLAAQRPLERISGLSYRIEELLEGK